MLSVKAFMSGMEMLKKCYIGWQFDTKDKVQVELWYSAFRNTTDEQFTSIIKEYITHNDYPPKCIKNLTDILVDRALKQSKITPERALPFVREIISDCGGWEYGGKKDIYKKLEPYPALYKTVIEFEETIKTMQANDPFAADRFRRAYEQKLRDAATARIDSLLGLSDPDKSKILGPAPTQSKLLGGALPYEK